MASKAAVLEVVAAEARRLGERPITARELSDLVVEGVVLGAHKLGQAGGGTVADWPQSAQDRLLHVVRLRRLGVRRRSQWRIVLCLFDLVRNPAAPVFPSTEVIVGDIRSELGRIVARRSSSHRVPEALYDTVHGGQERSIRRVIEAMNDVPELRLTPEGEELVANAIRASFDPSGEGLGALGTVPRGLMQPKNGHPILANLEGVVQDLKGPARGSALLQAEVALRGLGITARLVCLLIARAVGIETAASVRVIGEQEGLDSALAHLLETGTFASLVMDILVEHMAASLVDTRRRWSPDHDRAYRSVDWSKAPVVTWQEAQEMIGEATTAIERLFQGPGPLGLR
jgi:hypothetical protein